MITSPVFLSLLPLTSPSLPAFPPHICEEIKEGLPLIKKRLQSFGSTLSGSNPDSIPDYMELGHEVVADMLENSPQGDYCVILFNVSTSILFQPKNRFATSINGFKLERSGLVVMATKEAALICQFSQEYVIEMLQLPGNNQSEYIVPQPPPPPNDPLIPQTIEFNPFKVGVSIGSREIGQKQLMEMTLCWKGLPPSLPPSPSLLTTSEIIRDRTSSIPRVLFQNFTCPAMINYSAEFVFFTTQICWYCHCRKCRTTNS